MFLNNTNLDKSDTPSLRFLADGMLGTLARWLRILGYDTLFVADQPDGSLVRLARMENRVILTRDHELAHRRGVKAVLIESEILEDQLAQLRRELGIDDHRAFSRCPVCNALLQPADRATVEAQVPAYILQTQTEFRRCPGCHRIYWPGSHWNNMQMKLEAMK